MRPCLVAGVSLALLSAGCVAPAAKAPRAPRSTSAQARPAQLAQIVAAAAADASARTGAPSGSFGIVGAQAVTWRDGSLGCPQPGMAYPQSLVPGWRVRLRGAAGVLDYHAGRNGTLLLCPAQRAIDPLPDSRD
jgi:hypothetical protein